MIKMAQLEKIFLNDDENKKLERVFINELDKLDNKRVIIDTFPI